MLESQRAHFDVPEDVCYLNAAAWSPLPKAVVEAGHRGAERKARPWEIPADFAHQQHERARTAAARLINADPADVALVSSVGYGCSTAGKILPIPAGSRVLVLENDHTSPVLEWMSRAEAGEYTVEAVPQPADGDWTAAIVAAISRPAPEPLALLSISSVHWSDGGAIDLTSVAAAARTAGAMLLIDATHAVGITDLDVKALDPDVVVFPTYKWLLGPYGRAFLYVAKRRQDGVPLEQTAFGRRGVSSESPVYFADLRYRPDARRFDMGERDHLITLEMAAVGMEYVARLGPAAIRARLLMLTSRMADGLRDAPGISLPNDRTRAPHILSLGFPDGMPDGLIGRLAAAKVYVAPRLGRMRVSPHVYNTEADVDRFVSELRRLTS